jgi:aquaporin Z
MNPARTVASSLPSGIWTGWWLYLIAPVLGMLTAVETYRLLKFSRERMCAKLIHGRKQRCIHCGYQPHDHSNLTENFHD